MMSRDEFKEYCNDKAELDLLSDEYQKKFGEVFALPPEWMILDIQLETVKECLENNITVDEYLEKWSAEHPDCIV
ncbi:MAG: hypothetical protein ACI4XF_02425 [Oscillospiraceae bacterium]